MALGKGIKDIPQEYYQGSLLAAGDDGRDPKAIIEMVCCWAKSEQKKQVSARFWRLLELVEHEVYNPGRWVFAINDVGEYVFDKYGNRILKHIVPLRRGDVFLLAQQQGMSITQCREFRFDNTLWAGLSRYMIMFKPALSLILKPTEKPNGVDSVNLAHVWQQVTCSTSFFTCPRWQDADQYFDILDLGMI